MEVAIPESQPLLFPQYRNDPVGYARDVLHLDPWAKQVEIAESLLHPPYRTLVLSSHAVGKTFTGAFLTSWFFDTRDPGAVLTTAPTDRDVKDLLWSEIRTQRLQAGLGEFIGPAAPEMRTGPNHFAKGFTAGKGESFQGRHPKNLLCIFDEAVGVDAIFWTTTKTMVQAGNPEHLWVCFFNPTDSATQAYEEYLRAGDGYPARGWNVISMGAMDHPNIAAELRGELPLHPPAVRLSQLDGWVHDWCTPIEAGDATATDFQWPPKSGKWFRPGPLFECRAAGLWPSQGTHSVWPNAVWKMAEHGTAVPAHNSIPEIGCDPARKGDDFTSIHGRDGPVSLFHETHNGWTLDVTAGRLKQLCREMTDYCVRKCQDLRLRPEDIPVKIDVDGLGGGVVDQAGDYNFIGVSGASTDCHQDYKNVRTSLWFATVELAKQGKVNLAKLPRDMLALLRQQAMQPIWKVNAAGQCEVEPKEKTKDRLKRSPDDMDSLNLAYYPRQAAKFETVPMTERRQLGPSSDRESNAARRNLYGLGGRR
jgi:hypothetical protein